MCYVLVMFGLFAFIVLLHLVGAQQNVGDPCTLEATGAKGTCKLINDCVSAGQELQKHGKLPQTCGFQGIQPIVCCVEDANNGPERQPGEISKTKCQEHARYVSKTESSPTDITRNECGHSVVKRIIGGEVAGRKEFPHMVSIGFESTPGNIQWLCGGTIISDQYILTAAQCLNDQTVGSAKWVRLGVTNLKDTSHKQDLKVSERILFPEHKPSSHYHDIGLLKLEKPIKLNPYARPACLYLQHDINVKKAIATGWGLTHWGGESSDDLRKVTLDLVDHAICNSSYKNQISRRLNRGVVDEIQMCAGSEAEEKDTCHGDSGGPLQIYHIGDDITCMYDIVGITSFGKACSVSPGVYTRVSSYIKWIEDTVWPVGN